MATIKTTGVGRVYRSADYVEITVAVKRTEKTCADAVAATDGRVLQLRRLIAERGFGSDALKTTDFGISAEYENVQTGGGYRRGFVGFSCREGLKIGFPYTAERLSAAVTVLSGEGAEEQVYVAFTVENAGEAKNEALEKAYNDAFGKAKVLARASGRTLGRLITIFSGDESGGLYPSSAPAALSARSVSVAPEDVNFSASVTAEWELE